ncbi:hypothetical protein GGI09_003631 [Coemansia sp. S100]|nr:hypothetical protein LPJ71_000911 [Coemansia sp. S17]KAJ2097817.1 hypothetical protein GGI09_003631 [Coemansia sp. S100]KAJ2107999.1 hypothetical protein GGI16_001308 [Coemansia sp. S142-1]
MNSNRNNMPVVPAASRTESVILAAAQELGGKNRTIAELERANIMQQDTIDRLEHILTERDEKIAQLERTISKRQRALDEQGRSIARNSGHARRIEDHLQQAITIAGFIAVAPNGAAMHNGAAPRNTHTDNDTRGSDNARDNSSALDGADRDGDGYAHATVHTDTTPHGIAMGGASRHGESSRGSSPGGASSRSTSPSGSSSRGSSPGGALPRDTYTNDFATRDDDVGNSDVGHNNTSDNAPDDADPDDAPANQVADSPPVTKRPRVDRQVRDGSEQVITSVDLLEVASPFTIIDVRVLANLFEVVMRRQLVPTGMGAQHLAEELATLQGFSHWPPRHLRAGLSELSGLYLLRRSEIGLERLKSNIRHRLGLTGRRKAVVLGPVLCFVLFTLVGIPLELATGEIFERVFKWVTGKSLRSFQIITRTGTRQMELDEVCHLVKTWARNQRDFIVERGIEHSQKVAKECSACYAEACIVSDGSKLNPKLVAAEKMLGKDKHSSNLYLDLDYETELKPLFGCLFATTSNGADRHTAERLREIADEVYNQPE